MEKLLVQLLLAFAAGALLNLTPCVLPIVPVKVRMIINHSGGTSRDRTFAAAAFFAGTLLFFLSLGAVTAVLHWTWGTLFQSPVMLAVLVAALTGAGALMFVDARLPVPAVAMRIGGGRFFEPFSSGALAALLSTPCTGPFLGGVLAFALTQPPLTVISIFTAIATGLALPYVVILLNPRLLAIVPRGGEWSERLRQAMAFILFAGAIFFAGSLLPGDLDRWLWWSWVTVLLIWAGAALLRARSAGPKLVATAFSVLAISTAYAGGFILPQPAGPLVWRRYAPAEMVVARVAGRPALLEFTAAWCVNCKVLEQSVYAAPEAAAAVQATNALALRIDLTKPNASLEKVLLRYGGAGLPFAVVVDAKGRIVNSFSGLFSLADLTAAISRSVIRLGTGSSHET